MQPHALDQFLETRATHPWITFSLDLSNADRELWMLLGEARSKVRHLSLTPVTPDLRTELESLYLAKGLQATTAIEGNTLDEEQVQAILAGQLKLPPSQQYQQQEIENVQRACAIVEGIVRETDEFTLSPALLDSLNLELLRDLELGPGVVPGEIRHHSVVVGNVYKGPPAQECSALVTAFCDWFNDHDRWDFGDRSRDRFSSAIVRAIVAHLYLAWIHPYGDGNGRLSRLIEVGLLSATGLPTSAVHLLSNHYNRTRSVYYRRLDEARRDPVPVGISKFLVYAVEGLVDQLQLQLTSLHEHVLRISWRDLVDDSYDRAPSKAGRRQIEVAVALACAKERSAPIKDIRRLSVELADRYAGASQKTVTRDVGELERRNLVRREGPLLVSTIEEVLMRFRPRVSAEALATVFDGVNEDQVPDLKQV